MSNSDIPVSDNFDPVPGVDYQETPAAQAAPEAQPVVPSTVNEPEQPAKPAEPVAEESKVSEEPKPQGETTQPRNPENGKFTRKSGPIAKLLEKNHDANERAAAAEARAKDLEAQIAQAAAQPAQSPADVKALAEKYGIDETLVSELVSVARAGAPELPKEVQDLLAERAAEKTEQAERDAFDKRVDALAKALPDESFSDPKVREKLLELAYSTENAPDGEPFHQKELSELYFAYIKPEIEPGKPSAETSQGGTQATKVIDFEEIYNRDNPKDIDDMDSPTFEKYQTWVREHKESKTPLKRIG